MECQAVINITFFYVNTVSYHIQHNSVRRYKHNCFTCKRHYEWLFSQISRVRVTTKDNITVRNLWYLHTIKHAEPRNETCLSVNSQYGRTCFRMFDLTYLHVKVNMHLTSYGCYFISFKIVNWEWKIIFMYKYKRNKAVLCLKGLSCVLVVCHTQVIFSKICIFVITFLRHQQLLYCSILICLLSI